MTSSTPDPRVNINTLDYWNDRFGSGDWDRKGGFSQTRMFAEAQLPLLQISPATTGTVCDFGCGAGDSIPIYRTAWPDASLMGVDFSSAAIELCRSRYGDIATFICGDASSVPDVETIICSNVFEHLDDDIGIVDALLNKCKTLKIIVPYDEHPLTEEHVRSYSKDAFNQFEVKRVVVFDSDGWTERHPRELLGLYLGNVARLVTGRKLRNRRRQVLFDVVGSLGRAGS